MRKKYCQYVKDYCFVYQYNDINDTNNKYETIFSNIVEDLTRATKILNETPYLEDKKDVKIYDWYDSKPIQGPSQVLVNDYIISPDQKSCVITTNTNSFRIFDTEEEIKVENLNNSFKYGSFSENHFFLKVSRASTQLPSQVSPDKYHSLAWKSSAKSCVRLSSSLSSKSPI